MQISECEVVVVLSTRICEQTAAEILGVPAWRIYIMVAEPIGQARAHTAGDVGGQAIQG
jgi:hypothetical protein